MAGGARRSGLTLRPATAADAPALAAIYAHHVRHGVGSYEYEPPPASEFVAKVAQLGERGWPFLVACVGNEPLGYAYAAQLRERAGYRYTCEDSVYVRADAVGQGIGRALLAELITAAGAAGFRQMVAMIGGAEPASIALHAALGFREVGRLPGVGWKFGRALDNVLMQRALGQVDTPD